MELMRDRLVARWNRHFVGRAAELALLESLLRSGEDGAVVFVHGPGGVGKTTLLRRLGGLADEAGRRVVRVDGHDVPPLRRRSCSTGRAAGVRGATGSRRRPGGITDAQGCRPT
jgi:ABC-type lipoprotein export system ATPase subunit